jgi:hypothetical protein
MNKFLTVALLASIIFFPGCGSDKSTQAPVPPDDAPPLMPIGLASSYGDGGFGVLTWAANTEPDLAGYRVYVFDPAPDREGSYVLQNPDALLSDTRWQMAVRYGETFYARVTAVDAQGNESGASGPQAISWQASPVVPPNTKPPTPRATDPGSPGDNGPGSRVPGVGSQDPKEDATDGGSAGNN